MSVYPTLRYQDPDKAIAYLRDALGFTVAAAHRDDAGTVQHAELVQGGGAVLLGPVREGDRFATGRAVIYVAVDDPDAHHDRAVAAGATIIHGLTDQDYGSREYAAVDDEDNIWSFGTYRPGTAS
ncbi:putative glyoxalase superfamily protein PhnB [Actinomycetospora succinea]|uniref:Putative glyoxalase superfamily protein PhnB n=1 Tax=Actinomycetospora succinea TaxID=663603 RepID=A0A4R6VDT8_9PSEU|nr:VOC family protein [Actinomycetospora succinea]TDQ60912.1 putative glyoxalase superfamily protein PhnB [Actinomycetospora succinea]